ncbi:MAG: hypothetical protein ACM36A_11175, partial [Bacteroidota bacterium]
NREMELDELRKMRDEMQQAASEMESSVRKELGETEQALNQAVTEAAAPASEPGPHKELPEKSATPEARG